MAVAKGSLAACVRGCSASRSSAMSPIDVEDTETVKEWKKDGVQSGRVLVQSTFVSMSLEILIQVI